MSYPPSLSTWRPVASALGLCLAIGVASAQESVEEAFPTPAESAADAGRGTPLMQIRRIELSLFGGLLGGDTWLDLPAIADEQLTSDRGASRILDFSGTPQPELRAPRKTFESGWMLGGSATFYVGSNFGLQLNGSYGQMDAVLSGHTVTDRTRYEVDRLNVGVVRGGGSVIYNIGREAKLPIRPFVTLGFGGILLQELGISSNIEERGGGTSGTSFETSTTRDVTALYFQYGVGVSAPLFGSFRAELGANFSLYTFETDEVALDATIQFPAAFIGLAWRHDVPEDAVPANETIEDYD
jgi:hypothetical protein